MTKTIEWTVIVGLVALVAFLLITRLPFVLGPEACWGTCS